ncbi:MAG: OmpH family outer membrane protein [Bacteroidales bacterium]|nr:OmpH family outer membrane protein [Bacteroidales bacterium]
MENTENQKQDQIIDSEITSQNTQIQNENIKPAKCCMDDSKKIKISLFLNILLFVGLLVLYIIHFSGTSKVGLRGNVSSDSSATNIAFVNSDSLMKNYLLFDDYKTVLEERKTAMESEMQTKASNFEREVNEFQQKVQSYQISSDQAQRIEADLMRKQQQLLDLRESLTEELATLEMEHQNALFDSIINAITVYNKEYDFDYVLGYSKGSGILLANEKFDITPQIIGILNNNYNANK